jgi:hypothetical protein
MNPTRSIEILLFEAKSHNPDSLPYMTVDLILSAEEFRVQKLIKEGVYPKFTDQVLSEWSKRNDRQQTAD